MEVINEEGRIIIRDRCFQCKEETEAVLEKGTETIRPCSCSAQYFSRQRLEQHIEEVKKNTVLVTA